MFPNFNKINERRRKKTDEFVQNLKPLVLSLVDQRLSLFEIANTLNNYNSTTIKGCKWTKSNVCWLLDKLGVKWKRKRKVSYNALMTRYRRYLKPKRQMIHKVPNKNHYRILTFKKQPCEYILNIEQNARFLGLLKEDEILIGK